MQIVLQSFGPIKTFTFDLAKDFHLIVGENNVGKSYAMTMVYLILKTLLSLEIRNIQIALDFESSFSEVEPIAQALKRLTSEPLSASRPADEAVSAALQYVSFVRCERTGAPPTPAKGACSTIIRRIRDT